MHCSKIVNMHHILLECKSGEEGLDEIINDSSITRVVVIAGQFQASPYNSVFRHYQLIFICLC